AFQLTNFLRDVREDVERGRIYIPQDDLQRFGVNLDAQRVTESWRELMRYEIARTRDFYVSADRGVAYLPASSARCIRAARCLYSEILDRIEASDYDVFSRRARVPSWRKALVVARSVRPGRR
ncbi:MAG TPA: squalene/phytoene synthase family protein, partial [Acidimicrobiia bacterium]|nr:squalene/phytoene synthase family protein [Acidimicrobiia bacterium]